jgi:predicted TIM-barrel enzyme
MGFTRKQCLDKLHKTISEGKPIIGAGAGAGICAKCEARGGADLIIIYNTGRFRMMGRSSMHGAMPFADANGMILEMAGEVLPMAPNTPVVAGVCVHDPFRIIEKFLRDLKDLGFSGVQNYLTVGLVDGVWREWMEQGGMTYDAEVELIKMAHGMDFLTTPYVFDEEQAKKMAEAGADVLVAHVGATAGGMTGFKTVITLDEATKKVQSMHDAAKSINPDILVICHGGPIAEPEDVAYILEHTKGVVGFYGASAIERIPVEKAITERVQKYKEIRLS